MVVARHRVQGDPELSSVAKIVSESYDWDERLMDAFFYEGFLKYVLGTLKQEPERLSPDRPKDSTS